MVIPDTFGVRGERKLISYNWTDLITKTGYINNYLMSGHTSTIDAYNYFLCQDIWETAINYQLSTWNYGAPVSEDLDWETKIFTVPIRVGNIMPININTVTQSKDNSWSNATFKLIKVDKDSNETVLGSSQTFNKTSANSSYVYLQQNFTMFINITSTNIKIGEKLIFRAMITSGGGNSCAGSKMWIVTDPKNLEWAEGAFTVPAGKTQSLISIPFDIQL